MMRRTRRVIALALLLCSCGSPVLFSRIDRSVEIAAIDFTSFTSRGFLFTPLTFEGDYESVGLIAVTIYPDATIEEVPVPGTTAVRKKQWAVGDLDVQAALEQAYQECVEMGADALTQMVVQSVTKSYVGVTSPPLVLQGYQITGYAIRRIL
jgi:hypothetical protein